MNYFMKPPDSMDFREDHGNSDLWIPRIVAFNAETGALRCRCQTWDEGKKHGGFEPGKLWKKHDL